jgi:hypothetical protein
MFYYSYNHSFTGQTYMYRVGFKLVILVFDTSYVTCFKLTTTEMNNVYKQSSTPKVGNDFSNLPTGLFYLRSLQAGWSGNRISLGVRFFTLSLGPTQPPRKSVTCFFPGGKAAGA